MSRGRRRCHHSNPHSALEPPTVVLDAIQEAKGGVGIQPMVFDRTTLAPCCPDLLHVREIAINAQRETSARRDCAVIGDDDLLGHPDADPTVDDDLERVLRKQRADTVPACTRHAETGAPMVVLEW